MNIIEKIKLWFKVKDPAMKLIDGVKGFKSGYKTVSFWLTLLGSIGTLVAALHGVIPAGVELIVTTVLVGFYSLLRAASKAEQNATRPIFQSTEFWLGVLAILGNAFTSLQAGGINPSWLAASQTILAGVMAASQQLGMNVPEVETKLNGGGQ